jgi:hypothetical protein
MLKAKQKPEKVHKRDKIAALVFSMTNTSVTYLITNEKQ